MSTCINGSLAPHGSDVSCDGVYSLLRVVRRSSREKMANATQTVQGKRKKFRAPDARQRAGKRGLAEGPCIIYTFPLFN
jgi:hypothetical protein